MNDENLIKAPVQEPVAFKVIRGELCYKSQDDDQSYGLWCPVTPQTDLPFVDGTEFYTIPPAAQPAPVQEPKTTLENIEDAITALKDGWVATALNTLEEARLHEMTRTK